MGEIFCEFKKLQKNMANIFPRTGILLFYVAIKSSFIRAMYSYTGDFQWQKGSDLFGNLSLNGQVYDLGNTISNANTHNFNGVLDMSKFYKYMCESSDFAS